MQNTDKCNCESCAKLDKQVLIRMTTKQLQELDNRIQATGLTRSEYIRSLIKQDAYKEN